MTPWTVLSWSAAGIESCPRMDVAADSRRMVELRTGGQVSFVRHEPAVTASEMFLHPRRNPILADMLRAALAVSGESGGWVGYTHAENVFRPDFAEWLAEIESTGAEFVTCSRRNLTSAAGDSLEEVLAWGSDHPEEGAAGRNAQVDLVLVSRRRAAGYLERVPQVFCGISGWGVVARTAALANGLAAFFGDDRGAAPLYHLPHEDHPGEPQQQPLVEMHRAQGRQLHLELERRRQQGLPDVGPRYG